MSKETVIDKIRKLLALSKSSNEHEAANAAARAADLMRKHEIEEAHLRVADKSAKAEPIGTETVEHASRRQHWKGGLAASLARSLGCHMWWYGGDVQVMGRSSATRTMTYTYQYLCAEIDRLAHEHYQAQRLALAPAAVVQWKNGFRHGAAQTIANRLHLERKNQDQSLAAQLAAATTTAATSSALVLVKQDQAEVDTAYKKLSEKWRGGKAGPTSYGSTHGYHAGRQAGHSIPLGGGRALGSTPGKLTGGK